ncbi:hypothetical protein OEZ86_009786 [Tetradesmus obliquus]|uniref:Polycystin cation channel PKD1/PKD2 domain-containing protein n=1 Tax=Tetradesmus obliquus TaxID=3088 RepID=A0ABY8UQ99_TETOB|nr:hypothetical protein OEZ85_001228 [Tetradesmus obliquus]WIA43284.1 hypothetical protein OEZ86_009786 [Tetradesmus obliquus]
MTTAASSSLAPVSLTKQQTSAAVDPVVGYLSSLASTVDSLQQGVADMAAASSSMSDRLGQAFGEADQRKQDAATTKVSDAYKGLLADWQSRSQQVGSLSDQAARRFDEQLQASQDMAALVAATMATISDATTAAQRLQEKYVQQTLLMQAGGDEAVWVCNRTSKLAAQFSISSLLVNGSTPADASSASNSSSASQRRSLLASKAGCASSVSRSSNKAAAAQPATWEGYWLPTHSRLDADDLALPGAELPRRFIGAAPGKDRLVGGLLLHTTRKQFKGDCKGGGFGSKLDFACQTFAIPLAKNASALSRLLASLYASSSDSLLPYGVDPAFLRSSSLYQPQLQGRAGWFYNTSDTREVPPATEMPHGFFHRSLQGHAPGFPVLLPLQLSQARSAAALQYLADGNYLDRQSGGLRASLLAYNADLRILGLARLDFSWRDDGSIQGVLAVQGLPALASPGEGGTRLLAGWLLPLWLLTLWFTGYTCNCVAQLLVKQEGKRTVKMVLLACTEFLLELVIAGLMLAATLLLTVYCVRFPAATQPQASYTVYDAANQSPARIFMPAKAYLQEAVGMAQLWTAYSLLQDILLILLVVRLLRWWSFQAKLGIVTNTLLAAAPQLGHLLLVITGCLLLIACVAVLALGGRVSQLSSAGAAIEESFSVLLGLSSVGLADVLPAGVRLPAAEALLALGVYYLRVVLLVMVLSQYFMATLGAEFSRLEWLGHALHARSIRADVAADIAPEEGAAAHLQHELLLREEITAALADAVQHMERWTGGVGRWIARVQQQMDSWQLQNAHMISQLSSKPPQQQQHPQQQQRQQDSMVALSTVTLAAAAAAWDEQSQISSSMQQQ